jgi:hypothetical protein
MNKHVDDSTINTSEPIETPKNLPAVKKTKLPAKAKEPAYRAFDDFERLAQQLFHHCEADYKRWEAGEPPLLDRSTYRMIQQFFAAAGYYCREGLCQETKQALCDLTGGYKQSQIKRRIVGELVGFLIGSFPAAPNSPKVYNKTLIDEIIAANPSPVALESACREIRRTRNNPFPPPIAEVLNVLKEKAVWWSEAWEMFCGQEQWFNEKYGTEPIPVHGST